MLGSNKLVRAYLMASAVCKIVKAGSRLIKADTRSLRLSTSVGSGVSLAARSTVLLGRSVRVLIGGAVLAYGGYRLLNTEEGSGIVTRLTAAEIEQQQPSVCAENKTHSLYLWIHLKPDANVKECTKVAATLGAKITQLNGPSPDDEDEIFAGVGFGPNFYSRVTGGSPKTENYCYPHRKGYLGEMPSSGGDIFVHAKCSNYSKLYELCQLLVRSFPPGTIEKAEDIYGWTYQEGRDLSGFIDGTENPAEEEERAAVAVDKRGGSYCITQKWVHKLDIVHTTKDRVLEGYVGRTRADSIELNKKPASSHVARMVGTNAPGKPKPYQMVRHSQPYGSVCGESGLFFIGYADSPTNFEYMLDRMTGSDKDGLCDDVMRLTECVAGSYWYFPSQKKLKELA